MATQQRQPAARLSVGGNILSRMLQLEKQSKHSNSSANLAPNRDPNPLLMNPPVAAKPTFTSATGPSPLKMHTSASPAAVRESQSVPPAPASRTTTGSAQRSMSPPKPDPNPAPSDPTRRPSAMPRSHTLPALSIDVKISESLNPRKDSRTEMADDEESLASEICQSPSWSDFGGNKRKKEKKRREQEKREEEKRLKKEAKQQAADLKAGKRLSKRPPPAAMETQKMPTALRRSSIISFISSHSSSGENTRRQSRDEKRLLVGSIDSAKGYQRSHSTPATSTEIRPGSSEGWKSIISSDAPQLPGLPHLGRGWHSRSGSSGTDKSKSWGSDDAYEKELVNFAYQFQASANPSAPKDIVLDNVQVNQVSVTHSSKRLSGAWPIGRSQTDSDLARIKEHLNAKCLPPVPKRENSGDNPAANGQLSYRGGHADGAALKPKSKQTINDSSTPTDRSREESSGTAPAAMVNDKTPRTQAHAAQRGSSGDGSSYVHKQRMHQQQLSIARFEDEQAVKLANEMCAEEEDSDVEVQEPSIPAKDMTSPPQNQKEQPKPQIEKAPAPAPSKEEVSVPLTKKASEEVVQQTQRASHSNHGPKDLRKAPTSPQSPSSRNSRVDKFLGFTRRQKPEQEKLSLSSKILISDKKPSRTSPPPPEEAPSPPPVPSPQGKLDAVRVQNAVEAAPKTHHRRSETVEIVKPKETEEGKSTSRQSHSRTRTSSSQLLNEDLPLSRPLPRSTTAPTLTPEMKLPSAMADKLRNESPSKPERKSVTFERATSNAPENAKQSEKAVVKAPEIVVESVGPEGVVRKTSIKRPRSNPNMQLAATNAQLPSLDFLPQLKHQPLPKRSANRSSFMPSPDRPTSSQFPAPMTFALKPTPDPSAKLPLSSGSSSLPSSPLRPESYTSPSSFATGMSLRPIANNTRRRTMSPSAARVSSLGPPNVFGRTPTPSESVNAKPIAKLFVICCKCNFWHDLPSHIYEAMCMPKNLTRDPEGEAQDKGKKVAEATLETMVKCPWCEHCMSTWCCAGWTAILYLQERHH
ncbi:MAG: hypothetical protein LQ343_006597 [Gyalolechia ehrenbergii]|nr:MAG: hypothetical protein LQ343_006597 [Gyalolechia ehrenbergii]